MSDSPLWPLARSFAMVSLLAVGGANAVAPEIRRIAVERQRWIDVEGFAHLFGIAQAAPGPNVLLVSLVGWHVAGWAGLAVATLAVLLPSSLLALLVGRILVRSQHTLWFGIAQDALVPIALGLVLASGIVMARSVGGGALPLVICVAAALFIYRSNRNPLWTIAAGALAALAWRAVHGSPLA